MSGSHEPADVIVVGGGVVGVCSAYYLARAGQRVTLLEQGEICSGCSYGNACLITPSHAIPLAAPGVIGQALKWMFQEDSPLLIRARLDLPLIAWLIRFARNCNSQSMRSSLPVVRDLCRASLLLYEDLVRTEHLQFYFEKRGSLYVNSTDAGFEKTVRDATLMRDFGFEPRVLSGSEVSTLEPAVRSSVRGAVFYPDDAHGDCRLFVTGMSRILSRLGVTVQTHTAVSRLEVNGIAAAITDRGRFETRNVIVAAGSWSRGLLKSIGASVPIQPGKGYSVTIPKPPGAPRIPVTHVERKVLVTPIGDRLRFGGTMEFAGMDLAMRGVRASAALLGGREILVPIEEPGAVEQWCGLRPCTPDGLPIIDRLPSHPNVYIAAGHAMLGYTMGPITGKLIGELVCGAPPSLPLQPLRLSRF
jgi:D-amino-acid dehydrogenase